MERSHLDTTLSEDEALILASVDDFARERVAPQHESIDHAGNHPSQLWSELAELGLFGLAVPAALGGAGLGFGLGLQALVVERMARAAGVAGALITAQWLVLDALVRSQSLESLQDHLPGLLDGTVLGAPAGAEAPGLATTRCAGISPDVTLSGRKLNVPFPGRAGVYSVHAVLGHHDVIVAVSSTAVGVAHQAEPVLGLHGFECGVAHFTDASGCVVLEGPECDAHRATQRVLVSALLVGVARAALDHGVRYVGERRQFGRALRDFPAVRERLVLADARVEGLRSAVMGAARLSDAGLPFAHAARRARLLAAAVVPEVSHDALQVFGGYGVSREYPAERCYRDALFPGFGEMVRGRILEESMSALES